MAGSRVKNELIFGFAALLIVFGIGIGAYFPYYYSREWKADLELTPSSSSYRLWHRTPIPLYFDVFLFNWTNSDEFASNKSVVPRFREIGPFVFKEEHERVNVTWNDNYTVTYNQTRKWIFVPEESENISAEITNLNVILATVGRFLRKFEKYGPVINPVLTLMERLTVTDSARNWLFEGIDDNVLTMYRILREKLKFLPLPELPFDKFGWFYRRNMSSSYDGIFTIKTGVDDLKDLGVMDRWNHVNQTRYYKGECAMVNGTSGELFQPMYSYSDNLTLFISDICSSVTLQRNGSRNVRGVVSQEFVGVETTLDNGQLDPANECFCGESCAPRGARDVTSCRMGAPLYFSFPHFYLADDSYTSAVAGMRPNRDEHEFVLRLDPLTGMPTSVRAQLQINLLLERIPWLKPLKDVPRIYVPMMWFRERAEITPELARRAIMVRLLPSIIVGLMYSLAGVGLLIALIRLFVIRRSRAPESEPLIPGRRVGVGVDGQKHPDTDEKALSARDASEREAESANA